MPSVLIIDDEKDIVELISEVLTELGLRPTEMTSGEEALRHLEHHECDLVVLDLGLKGVSGWNILERMRSSGSRHFQTPVLVISGYPDADVQARAAGASEFLPKPFRLGQLTECVREMLKLE